MDGTPDPGGDTGVRDASATKAVRARWIRRGAFAAGALVVAYFGVGLIVGWLLDPETVAAWVEPRLEAAVNRDVELGGVVVRILPVRLRFEDVTVADPTGLAPSLAEAEAVDLSIRLLPLLRRVVSVDRVRVRGARVDLRVGPSGESNFGDFAAESDREDAGASGPVQLAIGRLSLTDAAFHYESRRDSVTIDATELSGDASVSPDADGGWLLDGQISGGLLRGVATDPDGSPVRADVAFTVRVAEELDAVDIRAADLEVEGLRAEVVGQVTNLSGAPRGLDLRVTASELPIESLATLRGDPTGAARWTFTGEASADLEVRGRWGEDVRPLVSGTVTLVDAGVSDSTGAPLITRANGPVLVDTLRRLSPDVRASIPGGSVQVGGVWEAVPAGVYDLTVQATVDLADWHAARPVPTVSEMGGQIEVDTRVGGPVDRPADFRTSGQAVLTDLHLAPERMGQPLTVPSGRVTLAGTAAEWRDTRVLLGGDPFVVAGEIRSFDGLWSEDVYPEVQARLSGGRLRLADLRREPPADTSLTYGRVAFARLGDRDVGGRTPEAAADVMGLIRPDSVPLVGTVRVELDTLIDRRGRSENVRAVVRFNPRQVQVEDLRLERYGGTLASRMSLSLGSDSLQPFSLTLSAADVDAGQFLGSVTPLSETVRGTVSLALDLAGGLDGVLLPGTRTIVGTGSFALTDGSLANTAITERIAGFLEWDALASPSIEGWRTDFLVDDGAFLLENAPLVGAPGEPVVGGRVGLDGLVDLLAAFDLPADRVGSSVLRRLGLPESAVSQLEGQGGLIQALLHVDGPVSDPDVAADPDASGASALAETLEEEAKERAQSRVEEQRSRLEERATGFLRGLLDRPEPDSVSGDTIVTDTAAAADTTDAAAAADSTAPLPPDSVPPQDTVSAPSAPADTLRISERSPHLGSGVVDEGVVFPSMYRPRDKCEHTVVQCVAWSTETLSEVRGGVSAAARAGADQIARTIGASSESDRWSITTGVLTPTPRPAQALPPTSGRLRTVRQTITFV